MGDNLSVTAVADEIRLARDASASGSAGIQAFRVASRCFIRCAAACLFTASLPAQDQPSPAAQNLLPSDAMIIETADLSAAVGKPRQLVLWMQRPEKILRQIDHPGESYCGDSVYGDHWYGPTRLSLVDAAKHKLLNTIEIPDFFEHPGDQHSFPIPFFVPNDFYYVPDPNSNHEGSPKILNLRDLTGEGYAGQFVLFEYEFCGTALTSVLGYSRVFDRAVQYQVQVLRRNDMLSLDTWVAAIFGRQPASPGHWDFTWDPGHGADRKIHEQVSFDPIGQFFVDQQEITPYPGAVLPK